MNMEKKKIAARKLPTAEEQEKALSLLLQSEKTPSVSKPIENEISKPEKKETKKKEIPKPKRQATIVRRKAQDVLKPLVEVQRVTIDLPVDLYDKLKEETDIKGTTIKWQIVSLLRSHFNR
jgi:hypothetical protein